MRRITFAVIATVAVLVLLFSYKTSRDIPVTEARAVATAVPVGQVVTAASGTSQTVTGTAADTRYGPVQVQITVSGGKLTAVTAVEYPQNDHRDAEINADAIPQLQAQALAAQGAGIDGVSGATFTTQGFITSLQSALDSAHFTS